MWPGPIGGSRHEPPLTYTHTHVYCLFSFSFALMAATFHWEGVTQSEFFVFSLDARLDFIVFMQRFLFPFILFFNFFMSIWGRSSRTCCLSVLKGQLQHPSFLYFFLFLKIYFVQSLAGGHNNFTICLYLSLGTTWSFYFLYFFFFFCWGRDSKIKGNINST